ncbi:MAG: LysM domain-containing protein, partial [Bacillota bacterium]
MSEQLLLFGGSHATKPRTGRPDDRFLSHPGKSDHPVPRLVARLLSAAEEVVLHRPGCPDKPYWAYSVRSGAMNLVAQLALECGGRHVFMVRFRPLRVLGVLLTALALALALNWADMPAYSTVQPDEYVSGPPARSDLPPVPDEPALRLIPYTVETGDSLAKLAKQFGVSPGSILGANPSITDP